MTDTALTDQLREATVLNGPDAWRTNGYMADAQATGLSAGDAEALAVEVSEEVSKNSVLFNNIKSRIARLALPSRSAYLEQETSRIILAAQSLKLSPDFVRDRWIPAELAKIAPPPTPPDPVLAVPPVPVPVPEDTDAYEELLEPELLRPVQPEPATPAGETAESMRRKVTDSLSDYGDHIPAPAIRSLFRTINYNEAELAVAIWNYLQIERYQPVTESASEDLREKLTSTDWRLLRPEPVHPPTPPEPEPVYVPPVNLPEPPTPVVHLFTATPARVMRGKPVTLEWDVENLLAVTIDDLGEGLSPKNRGWIKPKKTADYTLFDVNNNPLSTVRVEVIPPDRSGLYGVLFALFLLLLIYWFVRGSASGSNDDTGETTRQEQTRTEPTAQNTPLPYANPESAPDEPVAEPLPEPVETTATDAKVAEAATKKPEATKSELPEQEPVSTPVTPQDARRGKYEEAFGDKPYDKVELGDDERGWRRARKNGRWGYIDQNDKWAIDPEFDAVTPFKDNTAAAFLNGQLITIDRDGQQVRN